MAFPVGFPVIAVTQPSDHAELAKLLPGNTVLATPLTDSDISPIRVVVTGFFMCVKRGNGQLLVEFFQHFRHITDQHM